MKQTSIAVKEDLMMRLNRLKYQWGYKTIDQTIRHILEIKTPNLSPKEVKEVKKNLAGSSGGEE